MVIRHIREHAARANWFGVGIDLLIVILGVFLGMQANNWNEARAERQQGESYRARLIEDLRTNESDLAERRQYYRQVRRHALAALYVLEQPSRPAGEQFLIDAFQATQMVPRTLTRFTYDEMLAAGGIERLGDAHTRSQVKNFYAGIATGETTFRSTPPYREHLRRAMAYESQRSIRNRCREILTTTAAGEQRNVLPSTCDLDLDPGSVTKAVAQVRSSPGMTADLTRHIIDLDLKLDLFAVYEGRARSLRQLLETKSKR